MKLFFFGKFESNFHIFCYEKCFFVCHFIIIVNYMEVNAIKKVNKLQTWYFFMTYLYAACNTM